MDLCREKSIKILFISGRLITTGYIQKKNLLQIVLNKNIYIFKMVNKFQGSPKENKEISNAIFSPFYYKTGKND